MTFSPPKAPSLSTFDGATWRPRRYRKPGEPEEMGKNFYPISGAVRFGTELVLVPGYPLGAGLFENQYYLHLHRSLTEDDGWGLAYTVKDHSQAYHRLKITVNCETFKQTYWEGKTGIGLLTINEGWKLAEKTIKLGEGGKWTAEAAAWLRLNTTKVYLSSLAVSGKSMIVRLLTLANFTRDSLWPGVTLGPDLTLSKRKMTAELQASPYFYTNETICPFFHCEGRTVDIGAGLRTFRAVALEGISEAVGKEQWPEGGWKQGEKEDWKAAEDWQVQTAESSWEWWVVGVAGVLGSGTVLICLRAKPHRL